MRVRSETYALTDAVNAFGAPQESPRNLCQNLWTPSEGYQCHIDISGSYTLRRMGETFLDYPSVMHHGKI
eukprot:2620798-Amphidinium_carterae.4